MKIIENILAATKVVNILNLKCGIYVGMIHVIGQGKRKGMVIITAGSLPCAVYCIEDSNTWFDARALSNSYFIDNPVSVNIAAMHLHIPEEE